VCQHTPSCRAIDTDIRRALLSQVATHREPFIDIVEHSAELLGAQFALHVVGIGGVFTGYGWKLQQVTPCLPWSSLVSPAPSPTTHGSHCHRVCRCGTTWCGIGISTISCYSWTLLTRLFSRHLRRLSRSSLRFRHRWLYLARSICGQSHT
jgi:hypothetical protein